MEMEREIEVEREFSTQIQRQKDKEKLTESFIIVELERELDKERQRERELLMQRQMERDKIKDRIMSGINPSQIKNIIPDISAKSWVVYNKLTSEIVVGKKMVKKMEVASLTKIMTFCVCLEVLNRNYLESKKQCNFAIK